MKIAITITRSDFAEAISEVLDDEVKELEGRDIDPMGKLMFPLIGMEFAKNLERVLFREDVKSTSTKEKEDKEEK